MDHSMAIHPNRKPLWCAEYVIDLLWIPSYVDVLTFLELYQTLFGFTFFKQGTKSRGISNKDS